MWRYIEKKCKCGATVLCHIANEPVCKKCLKRGTIMSEENFDDFANKVKDLAMEIRAGICPIWQCGGELEFLEERTNWQEPDLKCKNCGATWLLQKTNDKT